MLNINVYDEIDKLAVSAVLSLTYEQGSISGIDGALVNSTNTIRAFVDADTIGIEKMLINCAEGYTYAIRYYDSTDTMIGFVPFTPTAGQYTVPSGTIKIGICLRYTSNITPEASENINILVGNSAGTRYINNRVDKIAESINDIGYTSVSDTLAEILANVIEYSRNHKFANIAYFTDTHSNVNDASSAINTMNAIMSTKMMNAYIHGGDLITTYDLTYDDYIKAMCQNMTYYKTHGEMLFIKGNHDNNHATVLGDNATKYQYHMMMQSHLSKAVFNPNDSCACYFYQDCEHEKVRMIILDSFTVEGDSATIRFDAEQLSWLYNMALDVTDGWAVIIFSHQFTTALSDACNIIKAFINRGTQYGNYVFPNDKITHFVGVIHGHEHNDTFDDSDGFNIVCVTKAYGANGAVDILTIDTTAKVLYETRIGTGSSRTFRFN